MANNSGAAGRNRTRNQEMAARLKTEGDKREVARCPICNAVISISKLQQHIEHHPA